MPNSQTMCVPVIAIAASALIINSMISIPVQAGSKRGFGTAIAIGTAAAIVGGAIGAIEKAGKSKKKKKSKYSGKKSSKKYGANVSHASDNDASAQELIQASETFERDRETQRRARANERSEHNRNLKIAIRGFINHLVDKHENLRRQCRYNRQCTGVRAGYKIKEITEGQVEIAVQAAYNNANLRNLSFSGDLWSQDALKVLILREAQQDIASFFEGVGVQGLGNDQMNTLLDKAAKTVYQQGLELSEVIAVTESFNRFIRTLYETTPANARGVDTIGSDTAYHQMLRDYIDGLMEAKRQQQGHHNIGLDQEFQLRFRLRRVLYDCLGGIYGEVARGSTGRTYNASSSAEWSGSNFNNARPAEISPDGSETLFQRVQHKLPIDCKTPLQKVSNEVGAGGLRPRPARWNAWTEVQDRNSYKKLPAAMPSVKSDLRAIFSNQ